MSGGDGWNSPLGAQMETDLSWDARELEAALADLEQGVARQSGLNAMRNALRPVANTANDYYASASERPFKVLGRIAGGQMADSLMQRDEDILHMFVGASGDPKAHLLEWGTGMRQRKNGQYTGAVSPQPALTPAWELHQSQLLESLGERLWQQIAKRMAGK